jgi:aconitate hydratase
LVHEDGSKDIIIANHTYNEGQIGWFVAGSALNLIAAGKAILSFNIVKNVL